MMKYVVFSNTTIFKQYLCQNNSAFRKDYNYIS